MIFSLPVWNVCVNVCLITDWNNGLWTTKLNASHLSETVHVGKAFSCSVVRFLIWDMYGKTKFPNVEWVNKEE